MIKEVLLLEKEIEQVKEKACMIGSKFCSFGFWGIVWSTNEFDIVLI